MTITHHLQKGAPIIVALIIPCLLAACTSQKSTRGQDAALESMMRNGESTDAQNKFMRDLKLTVATGMVAGRVIGGATVAALGNRLGPLGQVAVILGGALIGGVIGETWVGERAAAKKALAKQTESNLEASIKESQAENVAVRRRVSMLRTQLLEHKRRIAIANVQHNTKELAKIKGELKALDKKLGEEAATYDQGIGL